MVAAGDKCDESHLPRHRHNRFIRHTGYQKLPKWRPCIWFGSMMRDRSPYAARAVAPQRVRRVVRLALPHPLTFLHALKTAAQMRRSWYMALSQIPGFERLVRANDMTLVDHLWRTRSLKFELDGLGGARCPRAWSRACQRRSATTKRSCGAHS